MARFSLILLPVAIFFLQPAGANSIPSEKVPLLPGMEIRAKIPSWLTMHVKDIEKFTGKKLSLKEKIILKILQWKIKKNFTRPHKENTKDKGKTAMILGIIGIASAFLPYVDLISIPCTVLALILGYKAKKANPDDSKARTAIILGWVTVGLDVLALALVIVFFIAFLGA